MKLSELLGRVLTNKMRIVLYCGSECDDPVFWENGNWKDEPLLKLIDGKVQDFEIRNSGLDGKLELAVWVPFDVGVLYEKG